MSDIVRPSKASLGSVHYSHPASYRMLVFHDPEILKSQLFRSNELCHDKIGSLVLIPLRRMNPGLIPSGGLQL
jgi:hypothetical protein